MEKYTPANSKTPLTLITGALGSGKTTLLRHLLDKPDRKIAILMNEFGEIGIDSKILKGLNVEIAELDGGCVCCSLLGEFEAAVAEIIETIQPDQLVLETTGVAEPDALIFDIEESLPQVRLDGVITLVDADGMVKFPQLGHTAAMQIQDADLILLNKIDLVSEETLDAIQKRLKEINFKAPIFSTLHGKIDPDLLFGIARNKPLVSPLPRHQQEYGSFSYQIEHLLDLEKFKRFVEELPPSVIRAKGFIQCHEGHFLFNFVSGRWDLEPFREEKTLLVFIGKEKEMNQTSIYKKLLLCQT